MFSRWSHKFNTAGNAIVSTDHVDKEGTIVLMGCFPSRRRAVSSIDADAGRFGMRVTKEGRRMHNISPMDKSQQST
jgi:hypothetical protein